MTTPGDAITIDRESIDDAVDTFRAAGAKLMASAQTIESAISGPAAQPLPPGTKPGPEIALLQESLRAAELDTAADGLVSGSAAIEEWADVELGIQAQAASAVNGAAPVPPVAATPATEPAAGGGGGGTW